VLWNESDISVSNPQGEFDQEAVRAKQRRNDGFCQPDADEICRLIRGPDIRRRARKRVKMQGKLKDGLFSQLLEISSHNFDHIFRGFLTGFGIPGHVVADVIFQKFAHQTIDGTASRREPLKNIRALLVFIEPAQNAFQLSDDFFGAGR
jgi:hypothetical protein